jgi:molybdate/tungstate transport system substrate-binding protein
MRPTHPASPLRRRALPVLVGALLCGLVAAGCGSSSDTATSSPSSTGSAASGGSAGSGHSSVDVLYAASLQTLMTQRIAPAFHAATGDTLSGYPAGSSDLASEIKGKVRQGDVFISASPSADQALTGAANGSWVSWYAPFASTSLVLGYNPSSRFASALKHEPWYRVISQPGFRLGLTDPKLDPKGVLAVAALRKAAAAEHAPALKSIATNSADYFPEQDLIGRLQSGQLDAAFFYTVEASAAKIPTVSLAPVAETAPYTITILKGAPHPAAAAAFVAFLLGPRGRSLMKQVGLSVDASPTATGSGVPSALQRVVRTTH